MNKINRGLSPNVFYYSLGFILRQKISLVQMVLGFAASISGIAGLPKMGSNHSTNSLSHSNVIHTLTFFVFEFFECNIIYELPPPVFIEFDFIF